MTTLTENNNGFPVLLFDDMDKNRCALQMSSVWIEEDDGGAVGGSAVLLGTCFTDPQVRAEAGWKPVELPAGTQFNTKMHLNREQVRRLVVELKSWLDTGLFIEQRSAL